MLAERHFYEALGSRIRTHRLNQSLTQAELAAALGISRPSLANIEKGRQAVQVQVLAVLAHLLNASMDELVPKPQTLDLVRRKVDELGVERSSADLAWMERMISSAEEEDHR